jgi:hypothetical protein
VISRAQLADVDGTLARTDRCDDGSDFDEIVANDRNRISIILRAGIGMLTAFSPCLRCNMEGPSSSYKWNIQIEPISRSA